MGEKIMVAMSGGVDSSVSALLLKEQGHELCGGTLQLYANEDIGLCNQKTCCSLDNAQDARQVCTAIGIEHFVFNMKREFFSQVIEVFAKGYERGETPNPCIECNRSIKFSRLLAKARLLDYENIAMGHYVIREQDTASKRWYLKKAVDNTKDQSYVLYMLSQDELAHTYFPLGGLTKQKVREIAKEHGLVTAQKAESQDICFVPDGDYAKFLKEVMGVYGKQGSFVDSNGAVLGKHEGMMNYTIGQRRGLGISADRRLFVVEKNLVDNTVVLGDEDLLFKTKMQVKDVNWMAIEKPQQSIKAQVKSRYRQGAQPAIIHPNDDGETLTVEFLQPQRALTIGQAAVFYEDDVVLGGGTIC